MKEILHIENGAFPLILEQSKSGKFRVRYGLQVTSGLRYGEAAKQFGECYFHMLACDGKLNDKGVWYE